MNTTSPLKKKAPKSSTQGRFLTGSTMRHVIVMATAGAIGLMTMFSADLIDMLFLSKLGNNAIAAAIGFAGSILSFTIAINIGLLISAAVLVARAIGEGNRAKARRMSANLMVFSVGLSIIISLIMWPLVPTILKAIGATGQTLSLAQTYLQIMIPSTPIITLAMISGAVLRALGDAKSNMTSTIIGSLVNIALDPIFIFVFHWDVAGAAVASVMARITICALSLYFVIHRHQMIGKFKFASLKRNLKNILNIAIPGVLTNLATPIGTLFILEAMARHGNDAVAGFAVIARIIPVAFSIIFAISGAIGPIVGQNYGAQQITRVRSALTNSLIFSTGYTLVVALIIFLLQDKIISIFELNEQAAILIHTFANYTSLSFVFISGLFVANACFNNLGQPLASTFFNFTKNTLGTIPFIYIGNILEGTQGILMGRALGGVLVGILAVVYAYALIRRRERGPKPPRPKIPRRLFFWRPISAQSSNYDN